MGDYFTHWLAIGRQITRPPKVFRVNWFRTNDQGKFLWPGFGENLRVLKWVLERADGRGDARDTVIGAVPTPDALEIDGTVPKENMDQLLKVDPAEWVEAVAAQDDFFNQFGSHLPQEMRDEQTRLARAIEQAITPPDVRARAAADH
jgi:phosphoenolpyruvate carboxykinase (GTP)